MKLLICKNSSKFSTSSKPNSIGCSKVSSLISSKLSSISILLIETISVGAESTVELKSSSLIDIVTFFHCFEGSDRISTFTSIEIEKQPGKEENVVFKLPKELLNYEMAN